MTSAPSEDRDPTDVGAPVVDDRGWSEIEEQRRAKLREELADPGPSGPPASAEFRRAILGGGSQAERLAVACGHCGAAPRVWCSRRGGQPVAGRLCPSRGTPIDLADR